jgi:ferric-dicitrate binding protein FerR (iron transport regulator)
MSVPRFAQLASKALLRVGSGSPTPLEPEARARAIAALSREIAARGRKRRVRRRVAVSVLVAAFALVAVDGFRYFAGKRAVVAPAPIAPASVAQIIAHPVGGTAKITVSGVQGTLDDGKALGGGSRVVTPANGRATLLFSTGTTVLLHEGADMTVAAEGKDQVLRLEAGSIDLHVAKLGADETFSVDTSDSEVEVRGTKFRVSVVAPEAGCGSGTRTRVTVTEGTVVVRHAGVEARVGPGAQWPDGCVHAPTATSAPLINQPLVTSPAAVSVPGSTLADQNDLFAVAIAAKRRGDLRTELADIDRFLAAYPASPLTETATVERMRALRTVAPRRAAGAAQEYLARYVGGFARAEAEAIVAETP